jgi:ATP-dependent DNA helicase RecQ
MYKFISIAPEAYFKSNDIRSKKLITSGKYSYFVVDEAHTIKTYGTSFRKSYKDIGGLKNQLGNVQTIALTATAAKDTQDKILDALCIKEATKIVTGIFRENIKILRPHLEEEYVGKYAYISSLIALHPQSKILIFVSTVKLGDDLMAKLKEAKINSLFYYGKLSTDEKDQIHSRFKGDQLPTLNVVIATSAFGMGVDIQNIRHIVHLGPPLNLTEYVQQIGRAGRDGLQAYAHLLYDAGDEGLLEVMNGYSIQAINTVDYGYTEVEKEQIMNEAKVELERMIELCKNRSLNDPWAYLMDYFGESKPTFWMSNGLWITNILFITLAGLFLLAALYIIINMVST